MSEVDTLEDIDILLEEAEDPFDRPCQATRLECPNVALYRTFWRPVDDIEGYAPCTQHTVADLCTICKDYALTTVNQACRCSNCHGLLTLKNVTAIPRD